MSTGAAIELLRSTQASPGASPERPAWLRSLQQRALEEFLAAGFPTLQEESWRYTSLTALEERCSRYLGTARPPGPPQPGPGEARRGPTPGVHLCLVDGRFEPELSRLPADDTGIRIRTLARDPDGAEFAKLLEPREDQPAATPLLSLNTALLTDGLAIDVAGHANPQEMLTLDLLGSGAPVAVQNRVSLRLGPGARLALLVRQASEAQALGNTVVSVTLEAGAELALIRQQTEATEAFQTSLFQLTLGAESSARCLGLDLGGALVRNDLFVEFGGPGASLRHAGICLARQQQHIDNHVRIDHRAPRGRSETSYRCILGDRAHGVFNGQIVVHPGADGTDAQLANRNLLLASTAEIDTKPELEIYTDDVKCSHGATTGQLDPAAVFYLRARGIAEAEARRMLVRAFLVESLADCPIDAARALLDEALGGALARLYEETTA